MVAIIEATARGLDSDSNERKTEVVLGERSMGMNGISHPSILDHWRLFRFGSKGSLPVQSWMTEKFSGDRESGVANSVSSRILRA